MPQRRQHPLPSDTLVHQLVQLGAALRNHQVRNTNLQSVVSELAVLPADAVVAAGVTIAQAMQLVPYNPWGHSDLRQSVLQQLTQTPDLSHLFIFHGDGHVRAAALHAFEGVSCSSFFLAAIAYRLNDWAPPVRAAARTCVNRVFPRTDPEIVAEALVFLLVRTPHWQRWREHIIVLDDIMARPEVVRRLALRIRGAHSGPMGQVLRRAYVWQTIDPHLFDLASSAVLPNVRTVALRALIEARASWPIGFEERWIDKVYGQTRRETVYAGRDFDRPASIEDLIALGARDRSAAVRRTAADGLIKFRASLTNAEEMTRIFIDDKNHSVRERALFVAKQRDSSSIAP